VTQAGLAGSIEVLINMISDVELLDFPIAKFICEPNMSKRGLYPLVGAQKKTTFIKNCMNILAYSDGTNSIQTISRIIGCDETEVLEIVSNLRSKGMITKL